MPLLVRPAPLPEGPALRSLLLASLEPALGEVAVLEETLPLAGAPALVLDGEGRPTLVSFDADDGARAMVTGLAALEGLLGAGLTGAGPWLAGRHPALEAPAALDSLRLLVLGPAPPPGLGRMGVPARLRAGSFRAVRVGDQVGLLIDLVPDAPASGAVSRARPQPFRTGLVTLSAAEEAFFQHR